MSYPFVRGEIEDEEKNEKEARAFAVGLGISILMTMICLFVMIITPIYAMFNGINIIEFIKVAFSIVGYAKDDGDETYIFLMLIILLVNFSVIAWIGGLITRFWGNNKPCLWIKKVSLFYTGTSFTCYGFRIHSSQKR